MSDPPDGDALRAYEDSTFPASLRWQAVSFMRVGWPDINGGLLTTPYEPELRPVHFALARGDLLIVYAAVIALILEHAGAAYKVRGLGNVFTFPSSRGKGCGRRVVDAATRFIDESDADVGILFCAPHLEPFYAGSGWETVPQATMVGGGAGGHVRYDALRMMRFVSQRGTTGRAAFAALPMYIEHGW